MKKLNLINTALISLIISLFDIYFNISKEPSIYIFVAITNFFLSWVIPFIPYGISLFVNLVFKYNTLNGGFKLFKILWIIINIILSFTVIFALVY
jgi:hypothetical protein